MTHFFARHRVLLGILIVVFALAWAIWTFYFTPRSTEPSNPAAITEPPVERVEK